MNQTSDTIASNLFRVQQDIAEAARTSTRTSDAIQLIAVSKGYPRAAIVAALAAGQKKFGESTAQEALTKIPHFQNQSLEWHFIGHLQTNKAKFIPGNFSWLHSLDKPNLAHKLFQLAQERSITVNTLIEVNITRDPKKHGVVPEMLFDFIEQIIKKKPTGLALRGLMTIGPYLASEKETRLCFARLRALRDECRRRFALPDFTELSMGMSGDYVAAIKEGATIVRIGTAIFGERDYTKK